MNEEYENPETGTEADAEIAEEQPRMRRYYEEEKISFQDLQKHVGGPLISIVLHVIILIVLGTAVMFDPPSKQEKEDVVVEMKNMEVEPPPEPPPPPPQPQEEVITDQTFVDVPMERPTMRPTETVANVAEPVSMANTNFDNAALDSSVPEVETNRSQLKLSGAFAARSGAGRKLAIKKYGGSAATERAVLKALDWLVSVQNEDGSWGDFEDEYSHKVQLTCYALLCFLAHGETPQSEKYGEALMKGLKRVLRWEETGRVEAGTNEEGKPKYDYINHWNRLDSQARICIVLAEGFAITKIPALERGMNRSVDRIIGWQNPQGGFCWHKDPRTGEQIDHFDLYNGAFAYNALYSAYNAGCEHPKMEEAIKRSINALAKKHADKRGGFSRGAVNKDGHGNVQFNETAEGTLYLYLMGDNGKSAQRGYEWLINHKPNGKDNSELRMDFKNLPSQTPAVGWYYMTQAVFQATSGQGKVWTQWNNSVCNNLIREQHHDGYWMPPADKYKHYEEKMITLPNGRKKLEKVEKIYNESALGGWTEGNAKLWSTTFFCLTLEVYYRYLPTFEADGTKASLEIHKGGQAPGEAEENVDDSVSDDDISLD